MKLQRGEVKQLAEACGRHPVYMSYVLNGHKQASISLAILIEQKSGGKIRAMDLRPELKPLLQKTNKGSQPKRSGK